MSVFSRFQERYRETQEEVISLQDYLDLCKQDPTVYCLGRRTNAHGHRRTGSY